ncbi:DUF4230 domain-containing protein [Candidatus Dojkabacteria bacterium]|uniref:DUF4230 domain-containing protein n=1 Tax=Candidatus Dojkabacteria bacterium TaxID=2099670 RepID=A0A955L6R7_9BACT|nr:DUF4230 domain-containing protein [Candidatus Dojkabacteria bacterium]
MENLSEKIKNFLLLSAAFIAVALLSFFIGMFFPESEPEEPVDQVQITSETVVNKINDEAFLVTKTVFVDQEAQLVIDNGSGWSNFWWGQTIDAEALVRIDVGVDLSKITEEDIEINQEEQTITITIPDAEVLDSSIYGDIDVITDNGVLRTLFANDPNDDHNLATNELINLSTKVVIEDAELLNEAKIDSRNILQLVLSDLGYEVIIR